MGLVAKSWPWLLFQAAADCLADRGQPLGTGPSYLCYQAAGAFDPDGQYPSHLAGWATAFRGCGRALGRFGLAAITGSRDGQLFHLHRYAAVIFLAVGAGLSDQCDAAGPVRRALVFLAGLSLGMGMLAKYAAIWFLAGLVIWLVLDSRQGRGGLRRLGLFLAGLVLTASPTLIWNLGNQGQTIRHLSENANLGGAPGGLGALGDFLAAQFLVFGPLFLLLGLAGLIIGRERLFLACFSLPVLAGISLQALLSEANANWAITAAPALILAAGGLAAFGWARFASLALLVNGGLAVLLFAVLATASLGPLPIASDPLRRLKGWRG